MEVLKGRPVITASDYPQIIDRALQDGTSYEYQNSDMFTAVNRAHVLQNAYETLEDDFLIRHDQMFKPDGRSVLNIGIDNLELALVVRGCNLLDRSPHNSQAEIVAIDGLLKEVDRIKTTS